MSSCSFLHVNSSVHTHTLCASLRSWNACQHFTRATLHGNLQEKCRASDWAQNADTHFCLHSRNACVHVWRATLQRDLQEKCRAPEHRHTLCASLRGRNSCPDFTSNFIRKFTGKMPRPRLGPERRHTLCASLHSRNALQHFTIDIRSATLHRNLQEKCRTPDWA